MKLSRFEAAPRLVLDYLDAINRQDITKILECLSPDCRLESATPAPQGVLYGGHEAIARYWRDFFAQKKEPHFEIEEIFGLGFRCVVCWRLKWLDANGESKTLRGAEIFKIKEGLISEELSYVKSALEVT